MELAPTYSDVHLWTGFVRNWLQGIPEKATKPLHRATDLDPLGVYAKIELSFAFLMRNRVEEALHYANEVVDFGKFLGAEKDESGVRQIDKVDGLAPAHYVRAIVLAEMGRLEEAKKNAEEARLPGPGLSMHTVQLEMLRAQSGDEAQVRAARFASLLEQIGYTT